MSIVKVFIARPTICLFPLGQIVATPGALDLLDRTATNAAELLERHRSGDWGNLDPEDAEANTEAIVSGRRLLSCYPLGTNERMWVITEADRSVTTLLLPEEY
jgi:hypothetical protein